MGLIYFFMLLIVCQYASGFKYHSRPKSSPQVWTNQGVVEGKYLYVQNYYLIAAFLGIPFAKPPIGEKRFELPEPYTKWDKTIKATQLSPACPQYFGQAIGLNKSEDCLYLNIWTPVTCFCSITEYLPVLVWIYGGAFLQGTASIPTYEGDIICSYENVIVVTLNYRVGSFGFMNAGTDGAPGNAGLYDQIVAIKWIKENIQGFGGDPNKITIFAESAGAISLSNLLVSPVAEGLFYQAILESGTSIAPLFIDDYRSSVWKANHFALFVGCATDTTNLASSPNEVLKCMKEKNAAELADAENTLRSNSLWYFTPWYGNPLLPISPREAFRTGKYTPLPVLLGNNKDESTVLWNFFMPDIFPSNATPHLTLPVAKELITGIVVTSRLNVSLEAVFDYYFRDIDAENSPAILRACVDFYSDFLMDCPGYFFARNWGNSRMYWYTHRSSKDPTAEWMGVPHYAEVPCVFGRPMDDQKKYSLEDKRFCREIVHKWANFARTGNPLSVNGDTKWPEFSPSNPMAYELNLNHRGMIPYPRKEACEFWQPILDI